MSIGRVIRRSDLSSPSKLGPTVPAKFYGRVFKVPQLTRWILVVSGPKMIDDIRTARDDELSFLHLLTDMFYVRYTVGIDVFIEDVHFRVIRGPLTRNMGDLFPAMHDEIATVMAECVPTSADSVKVPMLEFARKLIGRTSSRPFVGLPLCRNEAYLKSATQFAQGFVSARNILELTPSILEPIAARLFTSVQRDIKDAMMILKPVLEERLSRGAVNKSKENDLIDWLIAACPENSRTVYDLTRYILLVNSASLHTTSVAFTNVIFHLAAYQEYIPALRQEIEDAVRISGWTKISMEKLRKMDSFIKESMRLVGVAASGTGRKIMKDFTFSDGTTVPAGSVVLFPSSVLHHDEGFYEDPTTFKGFRYSDRPSETGNQRMVSSCSDFTLFGFGRHACPGRFFAVNEIKLILSHILYKYDIGLEDGSTTPPPPEYTLSTIEPNSRANVIFKARAFQDSFML